MKCPVLITGNQNKADYLAKWLGLPVEHHKLDLDEIQSLDLNAVVEHKVRQAYEIAKKPVLVEDISLSFTAMGRLPGTFIKWFLQELDLDGLCRLADGLEHRGAKAEIMYALHDGKDIHYFHAVDEGQVPDKPRGDAGFGWNPIFIPNGWDKTYGEMDEDEFKSACVRAKGIAQLREFLDSH